jgi:hypothetical protein
MTVATPDNQFGPDYPRHLGATVARFRSVTRRRGLAALSKDERRAYGDAVEKAILALQRSEAKSGLPPISPKVNCASGTAHNTGADIHNAIRARQRAALMNCAGAERRARTEHEWRSMYEAAMQEKKQRTIYTFVKTLNTNHGVVLIVRDNDGRNIRVRRKKYDHLVASGLVATNNRSKRT